MPVEHPEAVRAVLRFDPRDQLRRQEALEVRRPAAADPDLRPVGLGEVADPHRAVDRDDDHLRDLAL